MKIEINPFRMVHCFLVQSLRIVSVVCVFAICSVADAQVQPGTGRSETGKNYRIGVGDVLKVIETRRPQLSFDGVRVNPEGKIRLPMLAEEITAVCLTEAELSDVIAQHYKKFILEPQVFVAVVEYHTNMVALIGAVNSPGRFDIQRPTRLLELLTFVNGPTANAGKSIQMIRQPTVNQCGEGQLVVPPAGNEEQIFSVLLADTLKADDKANPYLQAGDIISIAAADKPAEAYIIGNVVRPSPIELTEPITLSKAIAMAGGATKDAKIDKIKISRQDPQTLAKTEIIINMKEIGLDNQKDILLQANDIIDVPGSKPSVLGKIFQGIVTTATRGIIPYY